MWLTTSKNLAKKNIIFAKKLAGYMPNFKFVSRSKRSLERVCLLAGRKGEGQMLVLVEGENKNLKLRMVGIEKDGFNWEENSLIIQNAEFGNLKGEEKPDKNLQIEIIAEGEGEKEVAKFLGYEASEKGGAEEEDGEEEKLMVDVRGERLKIKKGEKEIMRMEFEWDKL